MVEGKPTRTAIYARISDDPEGREAGVTRQVEDCLALIERKGWGLAPLDPFIDNDISASTLSRKPRPAYDQMWGLVKSGDIDAVVYYTNGRLTRRPREYEDIIETVRATGVRLASVKSVDADLSTADGRQIARILAAADAAEAERISERVQRAFVARRAGKRPNPASRSFGYEKGGEVIVPEEAALIREAVHRIIHEGWSLGMVERDWNDRKVPTLRGAQRWSGATVRMALTKPRAAGLITLHDEVVGTGDFGIITPKEREQLFAALAGKSRNGGVTYKQRKHLLAGFAVCGKCNGPMKVNGLFDTDGEYRKDSFIVCSRSQHGCGNVKRNLLHVMAYVDGVVRGCIEHYDPLAVSEGADLDERVIELRKQLAEVEDDIGAVGAALGARTIRFDDYAVALRGLRETEDAITKQIASVEAAKDRGDNADLMATWNNGGVEAKRAVLAMFVDYIVLKPIGRIGPIRAKASLPESVEVVLK